MSGFRASSIKAHCGEMRHELGVVIELTVILTDKIQGMVSTRLFLARKMCVTCSSLKAGEKYNLPLAETKIYVTWFRRVGFL
jgi:hypothetical protein